ncbi:MAG: hypothetical protein ACI841_004015 [Planctomycetota bacterium]|jgi:hypothetical protein
MEMGAEAFYVPAEVSEEVVSAVLLPEIRIEVPLAWQTTDWSPDSAVHRDVWET